MKRTDFPMRKLCLLCLSAFLILSCNKGGSNSPTSKPQPADTAQMVVINTREQGANGNLTVALTAYNLNGTIKWKRTSLGTSSNPYITYLNGRFYISVGYFEFLPGGSYVSYNNLYAINASDGTDVWSKTNSQDYVYSPVVRNDTLYCSIANGSTNSLGAYSASTGALLWKKTISFPFAALNTAVDGGTLYAIPSSSSTVSNIIAFDLATKTIKWNVPIGINFSNVFSNITIANNAVFLKNGTGALLTLDKNTGQSMWSKTDQNYVQPLYDNNKVYTLGAASLYAFNASNGNKLWQWDAGIWFGGSPFIANQKIYISGQTNTGFIACIDGNSGTLIWKKDMNSFLENPIVTADKLFFFKSTTINPGISSPYVMMYNSTTGAVKDSFAVQGREFGIPSVITAAGKWIHSN